MELAKLWKEYAREYLGITDLIDNKILVNYNKWFSDKTYREELSEKLGLKFNDDAIHKIAKYGPVMWGDSFDGLEFDGRAQEMKVLERWKHFADDKVYEDIFKDKELVELSDSIFGRIYHGT